MQIVVPGPKALVLIGNLLKIENIGPTPALIKLYILIINLCISIYFQNPTFLPNYVFKIPILIVNFPPCGSVSFAFPSLLYIVCEPILGSLKFIKFVYFIMLFSSRTSLPYINNF